MRVAISADCTGEPPGLSISSTTVPPRLALRKARSTSGPMIRILSGPRAAKVPCSCSTGMRGFRQNKRFMQIPLMKVSCFFCHAGHDQKKQAFLLFK